MAGDEVGLKLRTTGGVVTLGEPILDLLSRGQPLVLEARVSAKDIEVARTGHDAVRAGLIRDSGRPPVDVESA